MSPELKLISGQAVIAIMGSLFDNFWSVLEFVLKYTISQTFKISCGMKFGKGVFIVHCAMCEVGFPTHSLIHSLGVSDSKSGPHILYDVPCTGLTVLA